MIKCEVQDVYKNHKEELNDRASTVNSPTNKTNIKHISKGINISQRPNNLSPISKGTFAEIKGGFYQFSIEITQNKNVLEFIQSKKEDIEEKNILKSYLARKIAKKDSAVKENCLKN